MTSEQPNIPCVGPENARVDSRVMLGLGYNSGLDQISHVRVRR